MDGTLGGLWPDETTSFQALGKEAQAVAIPPEQFDQIAAPATKDEDMTTEGIGAQFLLGDTGQAIESLGACRSSRRRARHAFRWAGRSSRT